VEVVAASVDRNPVVRWPGGIVRRYDEALWLAREEGPVLAGEWAWHPDRALILPTGRLSARSTMGLGLRQCAVESGELRVRARRGGERLQLAGKGIHQTLKHLWQAARVPPWVRARTPLIYVGGELAAVPGIGVSQGFAAAPDEPSWDLQWQAADG
jgi:tRNA(Ile)-lysidine synthase